MFLRFDQSGLLAEASPAKYASDKYTWFNAPQDFDSSSLYVLENGQVTLATAEQQTAATLSSRKERLLQQLEMMVDDKRMNSTNILPGKEREYAYKSMLVSTVAMNSLSENSPGYALLSHEAEARGISIDELVTMIRLKSLESHQRLGVLSGFSVKAKQNIDNAPTIDELDTVYQSLLTELKQL